MNPAAAPAHPALDPEILSGFHLIEADAGTGKTWTLVGLVVRALVERGLGIEQILMVTFTRAAAAELRGRVRERIDLILRACGGYPAAVPEDPVAALLLASHEPAAVERCLRLALTRIDEAPIDTIHGLCQRVIREHALSVGTPARFEIDQWGERLLRSELTRWWSATMAQAPLELVQLLGARGGPTLEGVTGLLGPLLAQPDLELRPDGFEWRRLADEVRVQRAALLAAYQAEADGFAAWCLGSEELNHRSYTKATVPKWLEQVRRLAAELPESVADVDATAFERLSREGFSSDPAPAGLDAFTLPVRLSELLATLRRRQLVTAAICHELRAPFAARLRERRELAETLTFDDLLRITRDALVDPVLGPGLAARLRHRYPLALIDECQDTDPLQWQIFGAIYPRASAADGDGEGPALVMVGDPKQAIYGFRNADVYAYFAARSGARLHRIAENRRSSAALLAAIGALFDCPAPFRIDEIEMPRPQFGARPRPELLAPGGAAVRADFNWVALTEPGEGKINKDEARGRAAQACAAEIARLLGEPRTLVRWPADTAGGEIGQVQGSEPRELPLQPRDIAVLVGTAHEAAVIKEALARRAVGAAEISRQSVFASREARELGRIVAAVTSPSSSSTLRGALVTGLVGWSAERLRQAEGDDLAWARVVGAFETCARTWPRRGAQAALRTLLLGDLASAGRVAASVGGERSLTNLAHLLDLMSDAPGTAGSPAAALAWLDDARAAGEGGEAHELRLESDANLVQVVTIHKSKGLEFPVVFVPFAWSQSEPRKEAGALKLLRYHESIGERWLAVRELDHGGPDSVAAQADRREQASEALRLLYVALTRAQVRLYLFWGEVARADGSALGWLLRESAEPDEAAAAADKVGGDAAALAAHVARAGGGARQLEHQELLGGPAGPGAGTGALPALAARTFGAQLSAGWVRRSFTQLARSSAAEAHSRPDHDEAVTTADPAVPDEVPSPPSGPAGERLRFSFVRGAHAGHCLHALLEATDFSAGVDAGEARRHLERNAIAADAPALARWLDEVLATPLDDGRGGQLDLRTLGAGERIVELPFLLPVSSAVDDQIFAAIAAHYPLDLQRGRAAWSGFLNGFIDLVYRHDGRYYLLDWKSNWLGEDFAAYCPQALDGAIRHGSYALQFCLYAVALHRLLGRRVVGYRFEEHFGGVHYAFLRGMAAGARGPGGSQYGVYFTCPPRALIERIDHLLAGSPQ